MIVIKFSEGRGRGIFATQFIESNTILFADYSKIMTPEDIDLFDKTSLNGHWFDHPDKKNYGLLPIGYTGLLNHSNDPNAKLKWYETPLGYIGEVVTITNIQKDKEIFIDYGIKMPNDWI